MLLEAFRVLFAKAAKAAKAKKAAKAATAAKAEQLYKGGGEREVFVEVETCKQINAHTAPAPCSRLPLRMLVCIIHTDVLPFAIL